MLSINHIADIVERKSKGEESDTKEYFKRYSDYFDALNRGQLCEPGDNVTQWTIFCFILFTQLSEDLCRTFVVNQFVDVAEKYCLTITVPQCRVLANILLNNYSVLKTPASTKEARLKELKLE